MDGKRQNDGILSAHNGISEQIVWGKMWYTVAREIILKEENAVNNRNF
jgi:hypothetical protein